MFRALPLAALSLLFTAPALAKTPIQSGGNLGLGLGAGTHVSGLSGKYFIGNDFAAQAVVGWWGLGRGAGGLGVSADGLFEMLPLVTTDPVDIAWNIGPGVNVVTAGGGLGLGVGGVAGLEFNVKPVPIDIVLEYRPGIAVIPTLQADLIGFGAHIRVYPF